MATEFTFSKTNDFPGDQVSLTVLADDILNGSSGLASKFNMTYSFSTTVTVTFSSNLTASEETELNNLVSGHGGLDEEPSITIGFDDTVLTVLLDEDGYFTYVGEAIPGTSTSAARWRIFRISEPDTGNVELLKTFANGTALFDKVWNDRTTYNYDTS